MGPIPNGSGRVYISHMLGRKSLALLARYSISVRGGGIKTNRGDGRSRGHTWYLNDIYINNDVAVYENWGIPPVETMNYIQLKLYLHEGLDIEVHIYLLYNRYKYPHAMGPLSHGSGRIYISHTLGGKSLALLARYSILLYGGGIKTIRGDGRSRGHT